MTKLPIDVFSYSCETAQELLLSETKSGHSLSERRGGWGGVLPTHLHGKPTVSHTHHLICSSSRLTGQLWTSDGFLFSFTTHMAWTEWIFYRCWVTTQLYEKKPVDFLPQGLGTFLKPSPYSFLVHSIIPSQLVSQCVRYQWCALLSVILPITIPQHLFSVSFALHKEIIPVFIIWICQYTTYVCITQLSPSGRQQSVSLPINDAASMNHKTNVCSLAWYSLSLGVSMWPYETLALRELFNRRHCLCAPGRFHADTPDYLHLLNRHASGLQMVQMMTPWQV